MKSRLILSRRARHAGVALIITLFFLVLVSIVVVGFLSTVRTDRVASGSHFERMRAQTFASEGIESVKAILQRETCDPPVDPNRSTYIPRNWVSAPGSLVVTATTATNITATTRLAKTIFLSSGSPVDTSGNPLYPTTDLVMRPPDLNTQLLTDQVAPPPHLLSEQQDPQTGAAVKMQVAWAYVRRDGTYDILNSAAIKNDPTHATPPIFNQSPVLTNTANPIVGRFAYWTDDENGKVNYNLAWTKDGTNTNPVSDPTRVDLRGLPQFTDVIANNLHNLITTDNYTTINRFFNSPFDARLQVDDTTRQLLTNNKFNLTHYNSDPDTTYYGQPRMMLTTQLSNAVMRDAAGHVIMVNGAPLTRPFLDILKNPSNSMAYIDPGITGVVSGTSPSGSTGNVDATKLNTVVNNLITNYLQRSDWPMVDGTGHSIQEKYYNAYSTALRTHRLAQLALNIIDYVRSAESQKAIVQPIRAKWIGNVFTPDFVNSSIQGTDDTFKGLTRAIHITEMSVWVSPTPEPTGSTNQGKYKTEVMVEIYLPPNYGNTTVDLRSTDGAGWRLYFDEMNKKDSDGSALYYDANGKPAAVEPNIVIPQNTATSQGYLYNAQTAATAGYAVMGAGQYRLFCMEVYRKEPRTAPGFTSVTLRAAISVNVPNGPRIDVAPLATPLTFPLDQGAATMFDVTSFETADPRVNGVTADWKKSTHNTFLADNLYRLSSLTGPMAGVLIPQDLDATGHISTASMQMPVPAPTPAAGSSQDPRVLGRVHSSGELGLIHAGIEGSNSAPQPGIPWRSLHMQPSTLPTTVVPDWAFMDLFTVPATVPAPASGIYSPHSNSTGGRVNVNAQPVSRDVNNQPTPFDIERTDPLTAVIYGATSSSLSTSTVTLGTAQQIAKNIYNHTLASKGKLPAGQLYPKQSTTSINVYDSPGEICEIAGVADGGEESEKLIRDIGNLITARGNVFTVYTVGQALKQTAAGKLVVTAEQRQEAMLERYQVSKGTPTLSDDSIGLRTVYFRDLTP